MALTANEEAELSAIQQEKAARQQGPTTQGNGLTPEEETELAAIQKEKASRQGTIKIDPDEEASLGLIDRGRYAIEPIESNRNALLAEKYGPENVKIDNNGDAIVNDNGSWRYVNKPGISIADAADFAGATPEIAGKYVGAALGFGAASIPGAMVGGATGALARQGLSAMLGTPQIASAEERAVSTGLGALVGGGAQGLFNIPGAIKSKSIGALFSGKGKQLSQQVVQQEGSQLANQGGISNAVNQGEYSTAGIGNARQAPFQEDAKYFNQISKDRNLPELTTAQIAEGTALQQEKDLAKIPIVGKKSSDYIDKQLTDLRRNFTETIGEFINVKNEKDVVGKAAHDLAIESVSAEKTIASQLYDRLDQEAGNAQISKRTIYNKVRDFAGKMGVINPLGELEDFGYGGTTEETFNFLQKKLTGVMDKIRKTPGDKMDLKTIMQIKRSLGAYYDDKAVRENSQLRSAIGEIYQGFSDSVELAVNKEKPGAGLLLKEANRRYKNYLKNSDILENILGKNPSRENVVSDILSSSESVKAMQKIIGKEKVAEVAKNNLVDIFQPLTQNGTARNVASILSKVNKMKAQIVESLSEKEYDNLVKDLLYLRKLNQPLHLSRESLFDFFSKNGIQGTVAKIGGSAVRKAATSAGDIIPAPIKQAYRSASPIIKENASGISNILLNQEKRKISKENK